MKPKVYKILELCISRGIDRGWNRAHKHNDNPSEHCIKDSIEENIMNEIAEYFIFDSEDLT
jgi:hypothetical protein